MNINFSSVAKIAASATVAAGVVALAAGPALAATGTNEAYGAQATGTLATLAKVADATPGNSPVTAASINLATAGLVSVLTTGLVTDTADSTGASSTVDKVNVGAGLLGTGVGLTADAVASSCSIAGNGTITGSTTLTNAVLSGLLGSTTDLDASPTVDEGVTVSGLAVGVTIELNHQFTNSDGNFEVDALYITAGNETITVGTSICAAPSVTQVPALPSLALPIGAGLLGLGGMGFYIGRRRSGSAA
jgi:hypothetical protein